MPVVVDPDNETIETLLTTVPAGAHAIDQPDRLQAWLANRPEEYVVVLGPQVELSAALALADGMRLSRPSTSVVLVRDDVDALVMRDAMHAGVRDVVQLKDTDAVRAAVDRAYQLYLALRGPGGAMHQGRIVTVFSPKGGVGKTTVSVNLALALADKGARKVCIVDLDLAFGDVAITLQLFPSHTLEHAIGSEDSVDAPLLESLLTRHADSVMVLAAPSHPDVRERVSPMLVSRVLKALRDSFDYIVVDTAPAFDEQTLTALDETDECVVVATLDVPTLKNVKVALETLEMLDIARGHRHLLLNRADDEVGLGADRVQSILGMEISGRIGSSMEIAAATNAGRPIMSENPQHASSEALRELATQLTGEPVAPEGAEPGSAGLSASQLDKKSGLFRRKK
ncbi:AAA family ATPase [Nocardioides sp. GXQ0305]|uniref:AAA family ATPase n=1 Tax=Nocardioides sp. GXQ0305 TaxID=3423912 RepID=UPI003D7D3BDD